MRSNNTIFKQMRRFVCVQNMQMHFKPNHLQVSTVRCIFGIYRKMNETQLSLVMTKRLWHLCGHGQFHPQIFARQRFAEELKSTLADGNNVGFFFKYSCSQIHDYTFRCLYTSRCCEIHILTFKLPTMLLFWVALLTQVNYICAKKD